MMEGSVKLPEGLSDLRRQVPTARHGTARRRSPQGPSLSALQIRCPKIHPGSMNNRSPGVWSSLVITTSRRDETTFIDAHAQSVVRFLSVDQNRDGVAASSDRAAGFACAKADSVEPGTFFACDGDD